MIQLPTRSVTRWAPGEVVPQRLNMVVKSTSRGCVNNRRVAVIKQIGTRAGGDDRVFGHDRAAADGRWKVVNPGVEGKIYARVRATSTCAADTSRTVRFMRADRG
jgi:hypothetical protein